MNRPYGVAVCHIKIPQRTVVSYFIEKIPFSLLTHLVFGGIIALVPAALAHLVERHLAKVEVASSSLVSRSK